MIVIVISDLEDCTLTKVIMTAKTSAPLFGGWLVKLITPIK